jgi:two-component system, chemotaxis family, protein-glutamate methylesterase/glutaminase
LSRPIRVLVVDDSAFARKILRESLGVPGIEVVGTARDGFDALEKIAALTPDVVTLDLMMPGLDGIGVLTALTPETAPAVIVCSSAEDTSAMVVHALALGAITMVAKPTALATERLYEVAAPLVAAVRLAASARVVATGPPPTPARELPRAVVRTKLLVIGASTGGPQAIHRIVRGLPAELPVPVALVVHMPVGYTEGFAARLDEHSALRVVEASDGAPLVPGVALVARAGLHLGIHPSGEHVTLDVLPLERPHRPSVDVLFGTAAAAFGQAALGVVLTGMGDDGLVGSRALIAAGGRVITQSASSCVVYGMPRAVAEAGLSSAVVDLDDMSAAILASL